MQEGGEGDSSKGRSGPTCFAQRKQGPGWRRRRQRDHCEPFPAATAVRGSAGGVDSTHGRPLCTHSTLYIKCRLILCSQTSGIDRGTFLAAAFPQAPTHRPSVISIEPTINPRRQKDPTYPTTFVLLSPACELEHVDPPRSCSQAREQAPAPRRVLLDGRSLLTPTRDACCFNLQYDRRVGAHDTPRDPPSAPTPHDRAPPSRTHPRKTRPQAQ